MQSLNTEDKRKSFVERFDASDEAGRRELFLKLLDRFVGITKQLTAPSPANIARTLNSQRRAEAHRAKAIWK